jgi:hypothetical protein
LYLRVRVFVGEQTTTGKESPGVAARIVVGASSTCATGMATHNKTDREEATNKAIIDTPINSRSTIAVENLTAQVLYISFLL